MPFDAFGKNLRPGDLVALNASSGGKDITIDVVLALKPKTIVLKNGRPTRALKVIIITEEQAREHHVDNFMGAITIWNQELQRRVPVETTPTQRRDEFVNNRIAQSREIKEMFNVTD